MNLIETYANDCGVRVTATPRFPANYFPTPSRYITFHGSSGMDSKNYDYYSEVIWMIKPYLDELGILSIQVGLAGDRPIESCLQYNGVADMRQSAFIVKNSMLHVGNDSIWSHFAGAYNVPYVVLFGPTLAEVCKPSFGTGHVIESDRGGKRASHKISESPKTINFIKPEEVAVKILDTLEVESNLPETLFIGDDYNKTILEVVPDHVIHPEMLKGQLLNLRMDYHFNLENLARNLTNYQGIVITDKAIDENILKNFSERIKLLVYSFSKKTLDRSFVKAISDLGINYQLSFEGSPEELSEVRSILFDYNPVLVQAKYSKPDLESITEKSFVKAQKFLLSKQNIYLSYAHWKDGISLQSSTDNYKQIGKYINNDDFWKDSNHYYILNENN